MLNLLNNPVCLLQPRRLTPLSAWHEHIPFGMFIVDLLRPQMIVELGTHFGDSYCALCQAVQELKLNTRCYAVDTWKGDEHTGAYGPEILADLRAHHDPLYGGFSYLIPHSFEATLPHFEDAVIDLLHIDAYHTYDAVSNDFHSWLPKVSQQGVVLFHDTNVRERGFGVWKFWNEIRGKYPHFEFLHGHGLGVLAVGENYPDAFQNFLEVAHKEPTGVREFFFQLGRRLTLQAQAANTSQVLRDATSVAQVFWAGENGEYSEENSVSEKLIPDGLLREYLLPLPATAHGRLRFDPVNGPAYVEISYISLSVQTSDESEEATPFARWSVENNFSGLRTASGVITLSSPDVYKLVCSDDDPQIFLEITSEREDVEPLLMKVVMRVSWDAQKPLLAELSKVHKQLQAYEGLKATHLSNIEQLQGKVRALEEKNAANFSQLQLAREELQVYENLKGTHLTEIEELHEALREQLRAQEGERTRNLEQLEALREQLRAQEGERTRNLEQLEALREQLQIKESIIASYLSELQIQESVHAGELRQLTDEITEAKSALRAQADELAVLADRSTKMQTQLAHKEAQLLEMTNSPWWKILSLKLR